ncbi:hypothetical protein HHI36_000218 [Cryptolaemus montrouzieri]|uniref:Uncharacterized protein n=1 Tax=Cryptolaemus montrouzieri TaxID=559131 RepID=A0ABD2P4R3_9CUCU
MDTICREAKQLSKEVHCEDLLHHLKEEQKQSKWTIRGIIRFQHRQIRGLLGEFKTSVFGVNDEVYQDIDNLKANQQEIVRDCLNKQSSCSE